MNKKRTYKLVVSGLFIALGLILPFITGNMAAIGKQFLPMHIPVLLCGFVCGPLWGFLVGVVTPLLRSVLFTMPPMFPTAVSMAFELAAYGALSGFLYGWLSKESALKQGVILYLSLIGAMIGGRIVMGAANLFLYGLSGDGYTWKLFIAGAFLNAIPGIVLQLVLVPVLVTMLKKAGVIKE